MFGQLKRTRAIQTDFAFAVAASIAANQCLAIVPLVENRRLMFCWLDKLPFARKLNFLVISALFLKINR